MAEVKHFSVTETVWRVAKEEDTSRIVRMIKDGAWGSLKIQMNESSEILPFLSFFRPWSWYIEDVSGMYLYLLRNGERIPRVARIRGSPCMVEYLRHDVWSRTWFDESGSMYVRFIIPTQPIILIP